MKEDELNEKVLPDDYPVYAGYLYVCDGKTIMSDLTGTVRSLKKDLREYYKLPTLEIKNCDIYGRHKLKTKQDASKND